MQQRKKARLHKKSVDATAGEAEWTSTIRIYHRVGSVTIGRCSRKWRCLNLISIVIIQASYNYDSHGCSTEYSLMASADHCCIVVRPWQIMLA